LCHLYAWHQYYDAAVAVLDHALDVPVAAAEMLSTRDEVLHSELRKALTGIWDY
jgi:hypothetical protein